MKPDSARSYWTLQILCWALQFYSQASGEVIFARVSWRQAGVVWGGICLTGLALTHLLRWYAKRHAWLALAPQSLLARAAISVLVLGIVTFAVSIALSDLIYGEPVPMIWVMFYQNLSRGQRLFNAFIGNTFILLTWVALYFGITLQRHKYRVELHQAQLSEALKAAQLRLLMAQLNPHFLFNSLNGVRALIADEPAKAQAAVTHLARTLRYTLASSDEDLVTLARELEMVDDYLALEALRLAERLIVVREIDTQAAGVRIPVMLVQTLVENAIKHGIAPLKQGGTLRLSARTHDAQLLITVQNPRPPTAANAVNGIGLRNCSERLRLLYGSSASLDLDLSDPTSAIASLRVPA